jgi:hypothetical protein
MASSSPTTRTVAPLLITPLLKCPHEQPEVGRYETLQRLVTESPNVRNKDAEIETAIEIYIGPNDVPLWKRVVVRSGPICPQPVIHASFPLPGLDGDDTDGHDSNSSMSQPLGNAICWTAFPEQPNHKLLCVLANPTLLCIWDVYPDEKCPSSVGEGNSIPLPFEASSIHALTGGHQSGGLLIQRTETIEDHLDSTAQSKVWMTTSNGNNHNHNHNHTDADDDDDGFVLQAPPHTVRTTSNMDTTLNVSSSVSPAIPSLFSLSHPLDDVLPISNMTPATATAHGTGTGTTQPGIVADVFEKVLFVGTLTGVDPTAKYLNRTEFQYPICVTYHTLKKRYA